MGRMPMAESYAGLEALAYRPIAEASGQRPGVLREDWSGPGDRARDLLRPEIDLTGSECSLMTWAVLLPVQKPSVTSGRRSRAPGWTAVGGHSMQASVAGHRSVSIRSCRPVALQSQDSVRVRPPALLID